MHRDAEPAVTFSAALLVTPVSVTPTAFPTMPPRVPEALPLQVTTLPSEPKTRLDILEFLA